VLTDSGGIQEEATFLGIPCFTLRDNTERPVTISMGTNRLLGLRPELIADLPRMIEDQRGCEAAVPPLWDGHAAARIVDILARPREFQTDRRPRAVS
jgi:UDP-N-acetylglucosamine 2-epimerase (non-hydrolysing)